MGYALHVTSRDLIRLERKHILSTVKLFTLSTPHQTRFTSYSVGGQGSWEAKENVFLDFIELTFICETIIFKIFVYEKQRQF